MEYTEISQFDGMVPGTKIHEAVDGSHRSWIYAGKNPKVDNGILVLNGGNYTSADTIQFRDGRTFSHGRITDDYNESVNIMYEQAVERVEMIARIYKPTCLLEKKFILGYDNDLSDFSKESLVEFKSETEAADAVEWVVVYATSLEAAKEKYEECSYAWEADPEGYEKALLDREK